MPAEVETMFYAGETPWHGLGTKLDHIATSEEAIVAAGLDWEVEMYGVYTRTTDPTFQVVPGYFATTRKTDNKVFGVMKSRFKPVQNREAFTFFDNVVGEKLAIYHTAGSLKEGAIVWILAKLPGNFSIKGDQVDKYLLLTNSHDGSRAVQMFYTPIRVVCWNTLQMADSTASARFYMRHTTMVMNRIAQAQDILGIANKFYRDWHGQAEHLALLQLPAPQVPLLLKAAFTGNSETKMEDIWIPVKNAMEKAEELIYVGRGQDNPKIQGTAWQAYNGIAEYVDYYKKPRGKNPNDSRLNSAWFGTGNDIKKRAWDYLLKL